jgi:hypothetical protein
MSKKISMHQPHFFPWVGLIDKIYKSDLFVFLDLVQLEKGSRMYRNILLTNDGKQKYLTIPYNKNNYLNIPYKDILINNEINWIQKHINFIQNNYKKSPFFNEIWPYLERIYNEKYTSLSEFCIESTKVLLEIFDIKTELIKQSDLYKENVLENNSMIIDICKKTLCGYYISGNGGKKYMDLELFRENEIKVIFQNFSLINYMQFSSNVQIHDVSSLDMLFSIGIKESRKLLKNNS